jgi:NMD protein affecting ribosome stability and mRNA decay
MNETLACPRCGHTVDERFYGPCRSCRDALRTIFSATKRDVEVADYEPKMNVTPNAVATKE